MFKKFALVAIVAIIVIYYQGDKLTLMKNEVLNDTDKEASLITGEQTGW
ncbi:MAG: hypothetical protein KDE63_02665 [Novosphingobium sp.]|nr:hypothetical protein [Novosphingobium sp.]